MKKYLILSLALLILSLPVQKTEAFGRDTLLCVHYDVPTQKSKNLGILYNEHDTCAMYYHLLDDEVHGDNPQHGKSFADYIKELTGIDKIHDPEICLVKVEILGNPD